MGIQPIDIQTLYIQMDNVSKNVVQQQQGSVLQAAMVMDAKLQKEIETKESVKETKKDEQSKNVKNDKEGASSQQNPTKQEKQKQNNPYSKNFVVIKDPSLGKNLDISG